MSDADWKFRGFLSPNYTQIPDEFFDEVAPRLSEAELRVALYVMRRTFGFKKQQDAISLKQMIGGITTRDGRVLDSGTGLSRAGVIKGVKGLVAKDVLRVGRQIGADGGDQANVYELNGLWGGGVHEVDTGGLLRGVQGGVNEMDTGSLFRGLSGVHHVDPQETVVQQTAEQERDRSNDSNGDLLYLSKDEAERIAWHIQDLARELNDQASLKSSATRAVRLFARSGLPLDDFLDRMQAARTRTQRSSASIKATAAGNGQTMTTKPKMAYFFGVLEDLVTEPGKLAH